MPIKEELDEAVPQHELLDVSASKSKADLASRGGLANRQLPTGSSKRSGSLSNSSSVRKILYNRLRFHENGPQTDLFSVYEGMCSRRKFRYIRQRSKL